MEIKAENEQAVQESEGEDAVNIVTPFTTSANFKNSVLLKTATLSFV